MCYNTRQTRKAKELEQRFKAKYEQNETQIPALINGFQHPLTPVITNLKPDHIQLFQWGLIPSWSRDRVIQKNTLNARIETIHEKPSFKNSIKQRCLVIVDGFYEWQWLDEKGKKKQKYEITLPDGDAFAMGGLWNEWTDRETGETFGTYTILTREAEGIMSEIHNSKKRMPLIIDKNLESDWLSGIDCTKGVIDLNAAPV